MKKITLIIFTLLVYQIGFSQNKNFIDQPFIEVSGNADSLVTPNEIFIRIVLNEKDTRDRITIEELEIRMVNALKSLNLDTEKDLSASDITSNFKFYFLKTKDVMKSKHYTLKVKDAVTASQVFIKLEEIEISNTYIDRVSHSELENIKNIIHSNAISNAKTKAEALTKPLNQVVGQAIHISDNENYSQQLQGRVPGITVRGATSYKSENKELPKIEFEKIRIVANINAKFILK